MSGGDAPSASAVNYFSGRVAVPEVALVTRSYREQKGVAVTRSRRRSLSACLIGLALVAAACGGDDSTETGSGDATAGTLDSGVKSEVDKQLGGDTATTEAGTPASTAATAAPKKAATIDDWLKIWAGERAAIVKKVKDNKWGISADGKTVTGPEGFTIDLATCPAGWSNTEGLTDTEIKIGHTTAQSGTLADYGNIAKAMGVLFDYVNTTGIKDSTGKTPQDQSDGQGRWLRRRPHDSAGGRTLE